MGHSGSRLLTSLLGDLIIINVDTFHRQWIVDSDFERRRSIAFTIGKDKELWLQEFNILNASSYK